MSDTTHVNSFSHGWVSILGFLPLFTIKLQRQSISDDFESIRSDSVKLRDDARKAFEVYKKEPRV